MRHFSPPKSCQKRNFFLYLSVAFKGSFKCYSGISQQTRFFLFTAEPEGGYKNATPQMGDLPRYLILLMRVVENQIQTLPFVMPELPIAADYGHFVCYRLGYDYVVCRVFVVFRRD